MPANRVRRVGQALTVLMIGVVMLPVGGAPDDPRVEMSTTRVGTVDAEERPWQITMQVGASQMVGFDWADGDLDHLSVSVQTADGWGQPVAVVANPDEGPAEGTAEERASRLGAGPIWVGEDAVAIRVRADHGEATDFRVRALRSVEPEPSWLGLPTAAAQPGNPGLRSRAEWGADESIRNSPAGCSGQPAVASQLRNAFVHHTVSANTYAPHEADDLIRGIYAFHVQGRGWCDIGYNFLVDRYGGMWEGRYGGSGQAVIGAHAGGFNTGSTGVALLGDHSSGGVTSASRHALSALLAWKLAHHGVDPASTLWVESGGSSRWPAGTSVHLHAISGHRDVSSTACPGNHAYDVLPWLRRDVATRVINETPYPMSGYSPQSAEQAPALAALGAYGGVVPRGSARSLGGGPFWSGWKIARALAMTSPDGGYLIDAWGGVHPLGDAPRVQSPRYRPHTDQIRGAVAVPGGHRGLLLDAFGGVTPFGAHPIGTLAQSERWPGWDIARGIAVTADGKGGYVLDGWGGAHPFGTATRHNVSGYWPGWDIARGIGLLPDGTGGWVLDGWGGLHPFGAASRVSPSHYVQGADVFRGVIVAADGKGGWTLDNEGRLHPFGLAPSVRQPATTSGFDHFRAASPYPVTPPPSETGLL